MRRMSRESWQQGHGDEEERAGPSGGCLLFVFLASIVLWGAIALAWIIF